MGTPCACRCLTRRIAPGSGLTCAVSLVAGPGERTVRNRSCKMGCILLPISSTVASTPVSSISIRVASGPGCAVSGAQAACAAHSAHQLLLDLGSHAMASRVALEHAIGRLGIGVASGLSRPSNAQRPAGLRRRVHGHQTHARCR